MKPQSKYIFPRRCGVVPLWVNEIQVSSHGVGRVTWSGAVSAEFRLMRRLLNEYVRDDVSLTIIGLAYVCTLYNVMYVLVPCADL